jgi:hypothetical protein
MTPQGSVAQSDSLAQSADALRVPITIGSGILGCVAYMVGAVLAIWSYAVGGFDVSDWKFWLGYGLLAVGIGVFVWLLQWNKDTDRLDPSVRRTLYGYNIFLGTMFLGAILILGNILVTQYGSLIGLKASYDWTSQGVFTLQDVSIQQAKALTKPAKIYALYQRGTQRANQLEQLFQLYAAANKNITWEFIDIAEDRLRLEDFFKKYPDALLRGAGGMLEFSIVVTYGEGEDAPHKVVKDTEIFKVDTREFDMMSGRAGGDRSFYGENAVTSAIRALMDDKKTTVYFTTGHGELDPAESERRSAEGIGILKQRLTDLNIKAEPLNLIKSEVPSDANIVVIAGPKSSFEPGEVQKVRDFMDRRDSENNRTGRLLVLLDSPKELPSRGVPHDVGLGELLASYQVEAKDNLVYDAESFYERPDQLGVQFEGGTSHQIINPLKNRWVLMVRAREIVPVTSAHPPGMPGAPPDKFQSTKLFTTSTRSWGQADQSARPSPDGPGNTPGPVCLGVAISEGGSPPPPQQSPFAPPPPPQSQSTPVAVVIGDATFACNYVVAVKPENEDLFLNAINWLGGRVADIGIQPKVKKYSRLDLDNAGYYTIIFEPFFHLVAIAGFAAGLVWVVRSDRFQLLWLPILGTLIWLALYAGLAIFAIGPPTTVATKTTVMRVFLTCVVLWSIGVTFWVARSRTTQTAESM